MDRVKSFTVPVTSGNYAPEVLYFGPSNDGGDLDLEMRVNEASIVIGTLVSGVTIELDLLTPGTDPDTPANWMLAVDSWNTAGLQTLLQLAGWHGARLRARSGGSAGTQVVAAAWR